MNIHEVKTQGSAVRLGPVTIEDDYGLNDKTRTPLRTLLVADESDKTIVKIWGNAANGSYQKGDTIVIEAQGQKGNIRAEEYPANSGKVNLNLNECRITIQDGVPGRTPATSGPSSIAHQSHGATDHLAIDEWLERQVTVLTRIEACVEQNFPNLSQEMKEGRTHLLYNGIATRWFGQKDISF